MSYTISRKFSFCAGHRVYQHESKCNFLHGHNYVALIVVQSDALDSLGRVIDFSEIKQTIGKWINDNWDHNFILSKDDPLKNIIPDYCKNSKPYIMNDNPTAENLSKELFHNSVKLLPKSVTLTKVGIWETENCYAEYS